MPHYHSIIGGRLVDVLKEAGALEQRRFADHVSMEHPITGYRYTITLLDTISIKRVKKLCQKHGIGAERFNALLRTVGAPT